MSTTDRNTQAPGSAGRDDGPPERLSARLLDLFEEYGVRGEVLDRHTARFLAVPVGDQFSKPRTNLLLRREGPGSGALAYADHDLTYAGADAALRAAVTGPCHGTWRRLDLPPLAGTFAEGLYALLRLLDSPLAPAVGAALDSPPGTGTRPEATPGQVPGGVEVVDPAWAAAAFESSFRQEMAERLAALTCRMTLPRSAILWGQPGCGRDHLLLAAAHPLYQRGAAARVLRLEGSVLAAGRVHPAELDSILLRLFADLASLEGAVCLIPDVDLCLTGSPVNSALWCNALDRGLRFLGTARSERFLALLRQQEPALARRVVAARVEQPDTAEVAGVLKRLAARGSVPVLPEALLAAARRGRQQPVAEPAASLDLLGGAMAEAAWRQSGPVGPDDVFATFPSQWPEIEEGD